MSMRKEVLQALGALWERYPDQRIGQIVSNVASWALGPKVESVWDVEDALFLRAIQDHLSKPDPQRPS